ncbi:MAG: 30S ribosomal protein S8e [Candidatus Aenigmatarchaeota archaeon]
MLIQGRSKCKPSGGKVQKNRKKKKRDFGRDFIPMKIGDTKKKILKKKGGKRKVMLAQERIVNVTDPESGKTVRSKIITVKENPANPHFVRMNIITKGAIVETDAGFARITSRPCQDGILNAILIKK